MKTVAIPNTWVRDEGFRLDPQPYASGAVRLRNVVLGMPHVRLSDVTAGFKGGIFTHLFSPKRTYVADRRFGIPFLGASSMRLANLDELPLLSLKDAESRSYLPLRVREGMTLISCSGSVGRTVYARSDMDGMASAGDLLKVQPNPDVIPPGYLFAFLSCRFGTMLTASGTYGTIVQHLEAQHIASIPVPRLPNAVEAKVHALIVRAASHRTRASQLLRDAHDQVREIVPLRKSVSAGRWTRVHSYELQSRLDAQYFSAACTASRDAFDRASVEMRVRLIDVADVTIPGIFKRKFVAEPQFGYMYLTGVDVFQISPSSNRYLLKSVAEQYGLRVERGSILIQEAGQVGGLVGRSVMVGSRIDGSAVSNNMVRVLPRDLGDAGYLYALLSTPEGVTLLAREAAGSSIPHIEVGRVRNIRIPWPDDAFRREVGRRVIEASGLRDEACADEDAARNIVESAVEGVL